MTNVELALMCQAMDLVLSLHDSAYADERRIRALERARRRMARRTSAYLRGGK